MRLPIAILAGIAVLLGNSAMADEGMWTFDNFPAGTVNAKYGTAIDQAWLTRVRGAACALPVVISAQAPLVFRQWQRGAALTPGVWNIPVPAEGEDVVPDVVIAPLVGFDPGCYRFESGEYRSYDDIAMIRVCYQRL